jgi:alkanesulfonate monooxygenase SsuD/methylene tetrahydromethanopterin reductase-like flavin-dependent oxidoreductase (luciferase family)
VARNVFVADSTGEARRLARSNSLGRCIEYILELTRRGPGLGMWKRSPVQADADCNLSYFLDEVLIVGDPEQVTRDLLELQRQVGDFGTLVLVAHDWDDRARWQRSLELFAREVVPALRSRWVT